jgi:hypothetical protein
MVVSTDPGICGAVANYSLIVTGAGQITVPFSFTGAPQSWTVPPGVASVTVQASGAQGNSNPLGVVGGLGGYATGTLAVTPGSTLLIYVGGGGSTSTTGGFNGGGNAGTVGNPSSFGGGGGGASDVRVGGNALANRVVVAGGGGGAGGNRVSSLGRGTGGGGGGGYYGGGGGAAWPYTSVIVPTGGTQTAGGMGGNSDWTSVPNNDGFPGALGLGGIGGDEQTSAQAGSQTGTAGGTGGGTSGAIGSYAGNFTGQSGAGGSGFTGGLTGATMTSGLRTGNGEVIISYQVPDTTYAIAGFVSGSLFPLGTTTNTLVVAATGNSDTCTFTLTVIDSTAPTLACPVFDTLFLDSNCVAFVPNYTSMIVSTDNCSSVTTESQSIAAGSPLTGLGSLNPITFTAADATGNEDSCSFVMVLMDNTPPTMNCPSVDFTPAVLDCNPMVNFTAPAILDNCSNSIVTSTHAPGDQFPVGSTTVTYTATDLLGNSATCSFAVVVHAPVLNGWVTMSPAIACLGDTITLTATPGYTYLWSNNATTSSISVLVGGTYFVNFTDVSGCTGRETDTVTFFQLMPVITPTGASLCTGVFTSYQWNMNGSPIPGATAQCYQPTTDGTFSVSVTDANGCSGTSDTLGFVGIAPGYAHAGFDLYPNPAGNAVNLRMEQPLNEQGQILVYDLTGRVVIAQSFAQLQGTMQIDLSGLAKGSYVLKVATSGFEGQRKLMHIE